MKQIKFILLFLFVIVLFSCSKDERIYFIPNRYTVSAVGGEVLSSASNQKFMLYGSRRVPFNIEDPYYPANKNWDLIETDFFTAERTEDYRIKFIVKPNTTGKEREYSIEVWSGDISGFFYLTQTAN